MDPATRCKNTKHFPDLPYTRVSFHKKGHKDHLEKPGGKVKGIEIAIQNGECHCYKVKEDGTLCEVGVVTNMARAKEITGKVKGLGKGSRNWIMCVDGKRITHDFPPLPLSISVNSTDTSNGKKCNKVQGRKQKKTSGAIGVDEPEVSGGSEVSSRVAGYISKKKSWEKNTSRQIKIRLSNTGTPDHYNYNDS